MKVTVKPVHVPGPTLRSDAGVLVAADPKHHVVDTVLVAHWTPEGGSLPFQEISIVGHLFTDRGGAQPYFVSLVFLLQDGRWGLGKTYRADFGQPYDSASHSGSLRTALRAVVCKV